MQDSVINPVRQGHDRVGSCCSNSAAMTLPPFAPPVIHALGHPLSRSLCATWVSVGRACRGPVVWRPCGTWHIAPHDQHSNAPAVNLSHRTSQTGPAKATTADHHGPCLGAGTPGWGLYPHDSKPLVWGVVRARPVSVTARRSLPTHPQPNPCQPKSTCVKEAKPRNRPARPERPTRRAAH